MNKFGIFHYRPMLFVLFGILRFETPHVKSNMHVIFIKHPVSLHDKLHVVSTPHPQICIWRHVTCTGTPHFCRLIVLFVEGVGKPSS